MLVSQKPNADKPVPKVLRTGARWQDLRVYHKTDTIYQLTFIFCQRFLPISGDRTVDQMVQAARSGKQNIVEGSEDGKTSTEMEIKLINVARSSLDELREDYLDYIKKHHQQLWNADHPRYKTMQDYTRVHNEPDDYLPFADKWTAEEFCNTCLTLCYQADTMLNKYLNHLQDVFIREGGIKERMYAARTGYRNEMDEKMQSLESENARLKAQNDELQAENARLRQATITWKEKYEDLKKRALNAYNHLTEELEAERTRHNDKQQP